MASHSYNCISIWGSRHSSLLLQRCQTWCTFRRKLLAILIVLHITEVVCENESHKHKVCSHYTDATWASTRLNHRQLDCLYINLFRLTIKKPTKLCITGLKIGEFPVQISNDVETFSFHKVIINADAKKRFIYWHPRVDFIRALQIDPFHSFLAHP